ncbi:MAG: TylF/MycF/NovP-related O-methyltransferase [Planctomycetota bacterium]
MLGKILSRKSKKTDGTNSVASYPVDIPSRVIEIFEEVQPFTMTSIERVNALVDSVDYIVDHQIPGDIVECGVWRGGSMMVVAKCLAASQQFRTIHLYDTFEGMSEPTKEDKDYSGGTAVQQLDADPTKSGNIWAYSPIEEVKNNLTSVNYPNEQLHFIKGKVEETIPGTIPDQISLLRLDTDWYESTYHELVHLFPRLVPGGVLIIDDYGHWQGAKKAVDQYFEEQKLKLFLSRIDYTGRLCIKLA